MFNIKIKYLKYILFILTSYTLFLIFLRLINIYSLLLLILISFTIYNIDKKKFKRIIYKVVYKDKKNTLSLKNKFGAAKISLNSIEEINKNINDKVKFDLINYEKKKLETQLKTGDYNVVLFGAGASGKTSIARSL